jgi:hypothetical protein
VCTKLDIYVCITITGSRSLAVDYLYRLVSVSALTWFIRYIYVLNLQYPGADPGGGAPGAPPSPNVVNSNPADGEVYSMQQYAIKFVSDLRQVCGFSPGTPFSYTNKTATI